MLNLEQDSFARSHYDLHGVSVCALALATGDAEAAMRRALALGCVAANGQVGDDELAIPAISAPDGSLLYFCGPRRSMAGPPSRPISTSTRSRCAAPQLTDRSARIDHIVQALPPGQVEPWVLFERAVLGLLPQRQVVLHDPYGVIRSREIESADKAVRCSLIVSERDNTAVSRSVAEYRGAGVLQLAIVVDDLVATLARLRRLGADMLPVPDNYYDDLAAKLPARSRIPGMRCASTGCCTRRDRKANTCTRTRRRSPTASSSSSSSAVAVTSCTVRPIRRSAWPRWPSGAAPGAAADRR